MPKNLGIDELAEEVTEEDLEAIESPDDKDDSDPEPEAETAEGTDSVQRLMELGVSRSRAESLPPEAREEMIPLIEERQKKFTEHTERLKSDAERYQAIANSQEFREFLLKREQQKEEQTTKRQPSDDGPPEGASEIEIFNWHVNRAVDERISEVKSENDELRSVVTDLLRKDVQREVDTYRTKFDDWSDYEPQIKATLKKHPTMTLEEAYTHVRAQDTEENLMKKLRARIEDRKKANTLKGGKKGTVPKGLEGVDLRKFSEEEYFDKAAQNVLERWERGELG